MPTRSGCLHAWFHLADSLEIARSICRHIVVSRPQGTHESPAQLHY